MYVEYKSGSLETYERGRFSGTGSMDTTQSSHEMVSVPFDDVAGRVFRTRETSSLRSATCTYIAAISSVVVGISELKVIGVKIEYSLDY